MSKVEFTFGGLHPQPGSGRPSMPKGQGASKPGTPWSPLSPLSPLRPRLPGGPCKHEDWQMTYDLKWTEPIALFELTSRQIGEKR